MNINFNLAANLSHLARSTVGLKPKGIYDYLKLRPEGVEQFDRPLGQVCPALQGGKREGIIIIGLSQIFEMLSFVSPMMGLKPEGIYDI